MRRERETGSNYPAFIVPSEEKDKGEESSKRAVPTDTSPLNNTLRGETHRQTKKKERKLKNRSGQKGRGALLRETEPGCRGRARNSSGRLVVLQVPFAPMLFWSDFASFLLFFFVSVSSLGRVKMIPEITFGAKTTRRGPPRHRGVAMTISTMSEHRQPSGRSLPPSTPLLRSSPSFCPKTSPCRFLIEDSRDAPSLRM